MDPTQRVQLIQCHTVANASLTRLQNFTEAGDKKLNDIQGRFNKLPDIFNNDESAQNKVECFDEADQTLDREDFENQYYKVEAKFNEIL